MSEYINNRELRKNTLKDIIRQLHEGKSVDEVKEQFDSVFKGVSAGEISDAENALVMEGMPVAEIQKLCDVHAAVFKGSIEDIHKKDAEDPAEIPGHPVNVLIKENRRIEDIIKNEIRPNIQDISNNESLDKDNQNKLSKGIDELLKIDIHYLRKENLMFPYMEKYGISAPPKVMWGVDDEIRDELKSIKSILSSGSYDSRELSQKIEDALQRVEEMIFKEENIMIPMLVDALTQDEWKAIADECDEFGFMIEDVPEWKPKLKVNNIFVKKEDIVEKGTIKLPTGVFNLEELTFMLNTMPFDITFVDKDDIVRYFSQGSERIFPRTKSVIGRTVSNCHPPASVHIVEKIVDDFKSGKKDNEDFWIKMGGQYVYIRYFAVRNDKNEYLGTLEVTQNIKPIQEITGEKRLVSD